MEKTLVYVATITCSKMADLFKTQLCVQDESEVSILYPLMYMHSVYSNMIDKVYRQFEVTWSLFMEARSGQLIVMRSEPHIVDFVVDIDGKR